MFDYVRTQEMKHRFAHERQDELRRLLSEQGTVAVADLAKRWQVSVMTVRRDLASLASSGAVARVHGGAVAGASLRFGARLEQHRVAKATAARKLIVHIPQKGCIYLDGSTTVYVLVDALVDRRLTVATNNLDTFRQLHQLPMINALLIGGQLNRATDNFTGAQARRCLEGLAFDAAFFSAFAVDPLVGASEPVPEDAEIKQVVSSRTSQVFLAVNQQKLGTRAAATWDAGRAILATDLAPDDAKLTDYRPLFAGIL